MRPDELERRAGSPRRAAPVLMLPDFERADRIGEFWGNPESRAGSGPKGTLFKTPLRICKRFSATVNGSMTRQPFARPTGGRGARRPLLVPSVSSAVTRQSEAISAATVSPERSCSFLGESTLCEGLSGGTDSHDLASRSRPLQVAHRFPNRVSQVRFLPGGTKGVFWELSGGGLGTHGFLLL